MKIWRWRWFFTDYTVRLVVGARWWQRWYFNSFSFQERSREQSLTPAQDQRAKSRVILVQISPERRTHVGLSQSILIPGADNYWHHSAPTSDHTVSPAGIFTMYQLFQLVIICCSQFILTVFDVLVNLKLNILNSGQYQINAIFPCWYNRHVRMFWLLCQSAVILLSMINGSVLRRSNGSYQMVLIVKYEELQNKWQCGMEYFLFKQFLFKAFQNLFFEVPLTKISHATWIYTIYTYCSWINQSNETSNPKTNSDSYLVYNYN